MFNGFVALTDETESGKKKKKMEKGSNGIQFSSQSAGSLSDRSNKSLVFFFTVFLFLRVRFVFRDWVFRQDKHEKKYEKKTKKKSVRFRRWSPPAFPITNQSDSITLRRAS